MKLVVVLVAVLLLVWLLLGSARRRSKSKPRDASAAPERQAPLPVEGIVACAHCGVHVPDSQALSLRGQPYCSAAHRDAGPRAP